MDQLISALPSAISLLASAGVLALLYDIWKTRRENVRLQKEKSEVFFQSAYESIDDKYLRFIELCLQNEDAHAFLYQRDIPSEERQKAK